MNLRLRLPGGSTIDVTLDGSSPFCDLLSVARDAARASSVHLRAGFPSAPVSAADDAPLSSIAALVGVLIVVVDATAAAAPADVAEVPRSSKKRVRDAESSVGVTTGEGYGAGFGAGVVVSRPSRAAKDAAAIKISDEIALERAAEASRKRAQKSAATPPSSAASAPRQRSRHVWAAGSGNVLGTADDEMDNIAGAGAGAGSDVGVGTGGVVPPQTLTPSRVGGSPSALLSELAAARAARNPVETAARVTSVQRVAAARARLTAPRRPRGSRTRPSAGNDLGVALVTAAAGAGGSAGEYMRAAYRAYLDRAIAGSTAVDRVSAVAAGTYEIIPCDSPRTAAGAPARLRIRFAGAGAAARKWSEEEVDAVPARALPPLLAILAAGDAETRAAMAPSRMAEVAPKTFWAVVRYGGARTRAVPGENPFADELAVARGVPVDMFAAMRALLPRGDLSFLLAARQRKPSEKALAASAAAAAEAERADARRRKRLGLPSAEDEAAAAAAATVLAESMAAAVGGGAGAGASVGAGDAPASATPARPAPATAAVDVFRIARAALSGGHVLLEDLRASAGAMSEGGGTVGCTAADAAALGVVRIARACGGGGLSAADIAQIEAAASAPADGSEVGNGGAWRVLDGAPCDVDALLSGLDKLSDPCAALLPKTADDAFSSYSEGGAGTDDSPAQSLTLLCDSCGKAREVRSGDTDLSALEALPSDAPWTCSGSGIQRLAARGGCSAPDDDLSRLLGSDAAAAAVEAAAVVPHGGPRGAVAAPECVAAALIRDDDTLLYCGVEGACEGDAAVALGARDFTAEIPVWFDRLCARVPPPALLRLAVDENWSDAPAGGEGGGDGDDGVLTRYRLRGFRLLHAAASLLLSTNTRAAPLSKPPTPSAVDFFLRHPIGLASSARIAAAWQAFVRNDVFDELLAQIVSGHFDELPDASVDTDAGAGTGAGASAGVGAAAGAGVGASVGAGVASSDGVLERALATQEDPSEAAESLSGKVRAALQAAGLSTPGDIATAHAPLLFAALRRAGLADGELSIREWDVREIIRRAAQTLQEDGHEWLRDVRAH